MSGKSLQFIVLFLFGAIVPGCSQINYLLDVTKLEVPKYPPDPPGPPQPLGMGSAPLATGMADGPPVTNPLRVVLESVDKHAYKRDEGIRYTIRLENVGTKPIPLPWTRDWRFAKPGGPSDCIDLVIGLTTVIPGFEDEYLGSISLYGAASQTESVRLLMPGQTARLIVPGKADFRGTKLVNALRSGARPEASVRANLMFLRGWRDATYANATSENTLRVTLESGN
jgi:hypothetical protein